MVGTRMHNLVRPAATSSSRRGPRPCGSDAAVPSKLGSRTAEYGAPIAVPRAAHQARSQTGQPAELAGRREAAHGGDGGHGGGAAGPWHRGRVTGRCLNRPAGHSFSVGSRPPISHGAACRRRGRGASSRRPDLHPRLAWRRRRGGRAPPGCRPAKGRTLARRTTATRLFRRSIPRNAVPLLRPRPAAALGRRRPRVPAHADLVGRHRGGAGPRTARGPRRRRHIGVRARPAPAEALPHGPRIGKGLRGHGARRRGAGLGHRRRGQVLRAAGAAGRPGHRRPQARRRAAGAGDAARRAARPLPRRRRNHPPLRVPHVRVLLDPGEDLHGAGAGRGGPASLRQIPRRHPPRHHGAHRHGASLLRARAPPLPRHRPPRHQGAQRPPPLLPRPLLPLPRRLLRRPRPPLRQARHDHDDRHPLLPAPGAGPRRALRRKGRLLLGRHPRLRAALWRHPLRGLRRLCRALPAHRRRQLLLPRAPRAAALLRALCPRPAGERPRGQDVGARRAAAPVPGAAAMGGGRLDGDAGGVRRVDGGAQVRPEGRVARRVRVRAGGWGGFGGGAGRACGRSSAS